MISSLRWYPPWSAPRAMGPLEGSSSEKVEMVSMAILYCWARSLARGVMGVPGRV